MNHKNKYCCSKQLILFSFLLLLFQFSLYAQTITVGLFCANPKSTISFVPENCSYLILGDRLCLDTLQKGSPYSITVYNDSLVRLNGLNKNFGSYKEITFTAIDSLGEFRFKSLVKGGKDKYFTGDFKIKLYKSSLCIYNYIDIEKYVEAVIESESGLGHPLEYYKVQAVISRTYARSNAFKHIKEEGYNLCDGTHCQAYKHKGKSNANVIKAVKETNGIVMVDDSLRLITAAFHSNCGGQTANSEQVWSKALPYLRSVNDNYCTTQLNAYWQKQIPLNEWLAIMKNNGINAQNEETIKCITNYSSSYRQFALTCAGKSVAFKNLRSQLKLKSAFFNISMLNENTVVLQGRGFGHGVGLCQEGAMKMAKSGKSYKEILNHYFTGVHIVNSNELNNFSEE